MDLPVLENDLTNLENEKTNMASQFLVHFGNNKNLSLSRSKLDDTFHAFFLS